jgi:hypothetical protein
MKHALTILLCLITFCSFSQDRIFNYTYQSLVLNKGQREIEVWNTLHSGRYDYYRALKSRIEFEVGLSKRLQTSFYINMETSTIQVNDYAFTDGNVVNNIRLESENEISFSNEWKYKLSDPVANSVGSALYGELLIGRDEIEIEAKLILDKKIGRTMHALNLVIEPEFESEIKNSKVEQEMELEFEADYGFMYNVNPHWNIGFELRDVNKSEEDNGWKYSALYGGPGFSFNSDRIWINFTLMPQIAGLYSNNNSITDGKILDDQEKLQSRLIFSYAF